MKADEMKKINEYLKFKLEQYARITGFDYKQKKAKEKLDAIMKENMRSWMMEAMAR